MFCGDEDEDVTTCLVSVAVRINQADTSQVLITSQGSSRYLQVSVLGPGTDVPDDVLLSAVILFHKRIYEAYSQPALSSLASCCLRAVLL